MTDLFAALKSPTAEVRYASSNQSLNLWRQSNIALPDIYVIDRANPALPKCLGEDGSEMTFERRQQLMSGKTPMFHVTDPFDNSTATFTDAVYTKAFDADISQERLGKSAEDNRPKGLRVYKPQPGVTITDMPILYVMETF